MRYGIDCVYPPTREQASAMQELGYTVCCVYIGGPRATAHDAWHETNGRTPVGDLVDFFPDGFLPIYVGRNAPWDDASAFLEQGQLDGTDATIKTGACGFSEQTPICLDLEAGAYQQYPRAVRIYCAAFVAVCNGAGHPVYLYSDAESCQALGSPDLFDGTFMAWWDTPMVNKHDVPAPVGRYDPSEAPPSNAWQYGGGSIAGVSVDFDSFSDDLRLAQYHS